MVGHGPRAGRPPLRCAVTDEQQQQVTQEPNPLLQQLQALQEQNARLRANEERLRTLFDSMDEGFCIIEFLDGPHGPLSDYIHIEANAAYALHAGIPNVVGQKVREMVPAEADGWVERYGRVLATGEPIRFERELVATRRHLELSAFRIGPASQRQVAVLFRDVTARRRAEAELQRLNDTLEARVVEALSERKLLADIVEGTNAFVQVVDMGMRWLAINSAAAREFERIFGVWPRVGDHMLELLAHLPEQREAVRRIWARALEEEEEEFVQIAEFGDPQRDRRSYEMRFNSLRDMAGGKIGAYQFVYDVTERLREQERLREAEEALRHSQKLEAVGQLTGGIAHDFNNLLTGIIGSLDLLTIRLQQGRAEDAPRYITAAQGAARRAASLTHRLLAFSRRQTLDPRPTDVNQLVKGMEELVSRTVGPHIRLDVLAEPGLWRALVDASQLENALLNLCINARDAMPTGGRITIETANRRLDEAAARQRDLAPGHYLALSVTDTGTGMSPDVMARAFDPFFTTKPLGEGTGLGLSMVYGFVRQSGGQVRIYSEVGRGTSVSLYLPRHFGEGEAADTPAAEHHPPQPGARARILVVDDEPTVRMLAFEALKEYGYEVVEAADGATGLDLLRADRAIDLMVTDVGLPGAMNGRQLADAARAARPHLSVIFITGYAENAVLGSGHLPPGMQVLTKPFAIGDLVYRVRQALER
jgi:PAS domain S-box-containing protein